MKTIKMDDMRIAERNLINNQVRKLQKYIDIDASSICKYHNNDSEYATTQIWKLKEKNKDRKAELDKLHEKLLNLNAGLLDNELMKIHEKNMQKNTVEVQRKTTETLKKKVIEQPKQQFIKSNLKYLEKLDAKEVERAYKYHIKSIDSIPDHIANKLKNMPNNKGYTWKGMYLFGELPAEENVETTSIFERIKGDITVITEWSTIDCKVYHKQGKNKKKLVESYKKTLKISGR